MTSISRFDRTGFIAAALMTMPMACAVAAEQPMPAPIAAAPILSSPTARVPDTNPITTPAAPPLRSLPEALGGWRFSGEADRREWVMRLSAAEATSARALQLALTSSISVAPETSAFTLRINGRVIAAKPVSTTRASSLLRFDIPTGVLQVGANAIEIEARQRHRVDCSVNATYELWSDIDPVESGLVVSPDVRQPGTLADLAALSSDDHGALRLSLVVPENADNQLIGQAMTVAETIALMNASLHPIVDVTREGGSGAGLDIIIAAPDRIGQIGDGATGMAAGDVRLLSPGKDDRPRVALAAAGPADLVTILARLKTLAETARRTGSRDGLAAERRLSGLPLGPGSTASLADFGLHSTEFAGRRFQTTLYARLPADLYVADTGKITLALDGGYAAHLDDDSRLAISVNGRPVAMLPLTNPQGAVLTGTTVALPLGGFRPGTNRIDISAVVAAPSDATCEPSAKLNDVSRFLLVASTSVATPDFPRIGHFPDLAATAAGGLFPKARRLDVSLHVPHPDADSLSAAATLAARLSVAAGRPIAAPLSFETPDKSDRTAIVVGASPDLGNGALSAFQLSPMELRAAWSGQQTLPILGSASPAGDRPLDRRIAALTRADRGLMRGDDTLLTGSIGSSVRPATFSGDTDAGDTASGSNPDALLDAWSRKFIQHRGPNLQAFASRLVADATGWIGIEGRSEDRLHPTPSMSMILTQVASPDRQSALTLVTAPSSRALRLAMEDVTAPARWQKLEGATAAYQEADESIVSAGSHDAIYIATEPLSFANSRLIAAGWLSRNPIAFGLGLLVMCLLTGAVTAIGLKKLGQRG